jgi:hypothetical protein
MGREKTGFWKRIREEPALFFVVFVLIGVFLGLIVLLFDVALIYKHISLCPDLGLSVIGRTTNGNTVSYELLMTRDNTEDIKITAAKYEPFDMLIKTYLFLTFKTDWHSIDPNVLMQKGDKITIIDKIYSLNFVPDGKIIVKYENPSCQSEEEFYWKE